MTVALDFVVEAGVMTPVTVKSLPMDGGDSERTGMEVLCTVRAVAAAGSAASSESASAARRTALRCLLMRCPLGVVTDDARIRVCER